jgi:hypothetical protein
LFDYALQSAKDNGLVMGFAISPNQGAGVPAPVDSEGLQWNMVPFNVSIPIGGSFNGTLPGWGTGEFVSASIGLILSSTNTSSSTPSLPNDAASSRIQRTLSAASLQDVTAQVSLGGKLALQFPESNTGLEYHLFAFYQVHTEYREQQSPGLLLPSGSVAQSPISSYPENGSWWLMIFPWLKQMQSSTFGINT